MLEYKTKHHPESGNALWLILLAVVLMGTLTAVISRSTDTAEQSGNVERYRILASAMMRHTAGVKEYINNLRLRGIGENQVSFDISDITGYSNGSCASGDCLLYSSVGGGAHYLTPSADWLNDDYSASANYGEWMFTGANTIGSVGSANPELIMALGYLRSGLCAQINKMLGISGIPEDADNFTMTKFQGTYSDSSPDSIDNMDGYETGCFLDTGGYGYVFYQVLIKR